MGENSHWPEQVREKLNRYLHLNLSSCLQIVICVRDKQIKKPGPGKVRGDDDRKQMELPLCFNCLPVTWRGKKILDNTLKSMSANRAVMCLTLICATSPLSRLVQMPRRFNVSIHWPHSHPPERVPWNYLRTNQDMETTLNPGKSKISLCQNI